MMREMALLFEQREISYDGNEHRIFCFPHIINIVVQHILTKFSKSATALEDADDVVDLHIDLPNQNPSSHPKTFQEACTRDPLNKARKIIVAIRASGRRRDDYNEWIKTGMKNKPFIPCLDSYFIR